MWCGVQPAPASCLAAPVGQHKHVCQLHSQQNIECLVLHNSAGRKGGQAGGGCAPPCKKKRSGQSAQAEHHRQEQALRYHISAGEKKGQYCQPCMSTDTPGHTAAHLLTSIGLDGWYLDGSLYLADLRLCVSTLRLHALLLHLQPAKGGAQGSNMQAHLINTKNLVLCRLPWCLDNHTAVTLERCAQPMLQCGSGQQGLLLACHDEYLLSVCRAVHAAAGSCEGRPAHQLMQQPCCCLLKPERLGHP